VSWPLITPFGCATFVNAKINMKLNNVYSVPKENILSSDRLPFGGTHLPHNNIG